MDLHDSAAHKAFREDVRAFLTEHGAEAPIETAMSYRLLPKPYSLQVRAWQQLLVERGYANRTIPKEYGGFGAEPDILKSRIIADEFFAADIPQGLISQGISMLMPTLLEHGTEEQKQQWIRPTLQGDVFWCQGYSEPGAGSDLASLTTHAVEDGDDFVINGQKIWTSSAHIAQMIFCLVRTEPEASKYAGISYLIFSMDTPGIDVRPLQTMTGHPSFNEVFFTDVRVPKSQVVGGRGKGWTVANSTLKHERGMLSNANGSLDRLNRIQALMMRETVAGETLMHNPVMCDRFIALQARVQSMRLHEMRLISAAQKGEGPGLGDMVCKLLGCELNHQLDALAIDAFGELGVFYDGIPSMQSDGIWQQLYMYDLGLIIGGGTAQIQKNIIAERGLGMPREPKAVQV
ncbi:MAG: acyl-CoA dehydrogenase [Alphaproteobacteria bacterium]|jgi:alkylation response protein AidB-like acyl-CoA dehydrogenase|nr:acyl-CoA dehydrogenase [Alphaproteobacteria bacterium]MBT4966481.1 acyl-CoA dehydrogenase [Alphaproteobacteria bacterium]MBT5159083.1 acyl-CoA dehydrogenase [Alphaproteobacteria bacterium]MBT5919925.1 acyl-CoA dehydrogenase [Alphaproteobacteria bacterium]MBT6385945.1 acyl-CoA dehydrogenase [Alphaproteobacteria bacterium]